MGPAPGFPSPVSSDTFVSLLALSAPPPPPHQPWPGDIPLCSVLTLPHGHRSSLLPGVTWMQDPPPSACPPKRGLRPQHPGQPFGNDLPTPNKPGPTKAGTLPCPTPQTTPSDPKPNEPIPGFPPLYRQGPALISRDAHRLSAFRFSGSDAATRALAVSHRQSRCLDPKSGRRQGYPRPVRVWPLGSLVPSAHPQTQGKASTVNHGNTRSYSLLMTTQLQGSHIISRMRTQDVVRTVPAQDSLCDPG